MKSYRVTATFPELPAAHAVQEARGEGSSLSVGIKRALDAILREPHVKGRRISTVKLFVRVEQHEGNYRDSLETHISPPLAPPWE